MSFSVDSSSRVGILMNPGRYLSFSYFSLVADVSGFVVVARFFILGRDYEEVCKRESPTAYAQSNC